MLRHSIGGIALVAALAVSAGCTVPVEEGRPFNIGYADQIILGRTTKAEVAANLGPPMSKAVDRDGKEAWAYLHMSGVGTSAIVATSARVSAEQLRLVFRGDVVTDCQMAVGSNTSSGAFVPGSSNTNAEVRACGRKA